MIESQSARTWSCAGRSHLPVMGDTCQSEEGCNRWVAKRAPLRSGKNVKLREIQFLGETVRKVSRKRSWVQ